MLNSRNPEILYLPIQHTLERLISHKADKELVHVGNLKRRYRHRAVAPVIATLLLVAITVVGGTIIFVFSQGFFNQSQISGTPTIESIKILGFDARDVSALQTHNGNPMLLASSGGDGDGLSEQHERVAIHVKNDSVHKILLAELVFGGTTYAYANAGTLDAQGAASNIQGGQYDIWLSDDGATDILLTETAAEIAPGQSVTIILGLDGAFKTGRDTQLKMTTTNGAVFVGTVVVGQQIG